ncbi:hypothetical protein [Burkholderia ubonensis]|uniref:hypothetical protein n=1 Tax=Burkholderia ubonensis TaxID=101571 RepID=UPI0012FA52E3|nr:hypothetical protein [Burkholderia ubonensis]
MKSQDKHRAASTAPPSYESDLGASGHSLPRRVDEYSPVHARQDPLMPETRDSSRCSASNAFGTPRRKFATYIPAKTTRAGRDSLAFALAFAASCLISRPSGRIPDVSVSVVAATTDDASAPLTARDEQPVDRALDDGEATLAHPLNVNSAPARPLTGGLPIHLASLGDGMPLPDSPLPPGPLPDTSFDPFPLARGLSAAFPVELPTLDTLRSTPTRMTASTSTDALPETIARDDFQSEQDDAPQRFYADLVAAAAHAPFDEASIAPIPSMRVRLAIDIARNTPLPLDADSADAWLASCQPFALSETKLDAEPFSLASSDGDDTPMLETQLNSRRFQSPAENAGELHDAVKGPANP